MPHKRSSAAASPRTATLDHDAKLQRVLTMVADPSDKRTKKQIALDEGISISTIHRHLHTTLGSTGERADAQQKLSPALESTICDVIITNSHRYMPMPPASIKHVAQDVLRQVTDQADAMLGVNWTSTFKKRQPQLKGKWEEIGAPGGAREVTRGDVEVYFERLQATLDEHGIALDQIYNMDETGFQLNEKTRQYVYTDRIANPRGRTKQMAQQNNITAVEVIRNSAAAPLPMPGYLILKGRSEAIHGGMLKRGGEYGALRITKNEKGFQNSETMKDWLKHFNEATRHGVRGKRLLLLDGYSSHRTPHVSSIAESMGIVLFSMPSNATSLLQPLDVGVFLHLKDGYKRMLRQTQITQSTHRFPVKDFVASYERMRRANMTSAVVTAAFQRCGIGAKGLNAQAVLRKMPRPRTPSPTPVSAAAEAILETPRTAGKISNVIRSLAAASPRKRRRLEMKAVKGVESMHGELIQLQRQLQPAEDEAEEDAMPHSRMQVSGSSQAGQVRDILVEREQARDARAAARPQGHRRASPKPAAASSLDLSDAPDATIESDAESSDLTSPPPLRPRRAAAGGSAAAIRAELRNNRRLLERLAYSSAQSSSTS